MNTHTKGNIALGKAIAYFTEQEYTVSIPLNDSQYYDLIVEKDGVLQTVQVKYTSSIKPSGAYKCKLRTVSGTSRQVIYTVKDTYVTLLFCYCANGDMFLIPTKDFDNQSEIALSRNRAVNANKETLDTSKYVIN